MPAHKNNDSRGAIPRDSVRLYVLECGKISGVTSAEFGFEEGALSSEMFTACYLVVHPEGTLLWETGAIPDHALNADGAPTTDRTFTVTKPLLPQLAELGFAPDDITYLAMSHYHNDHVANANAFSRCHWLVQKAEREAMFADEPDTERNGPILPNREFFSDLEHSETTVIENRDHDVFGDGSVVLKFTPGHTPGHQSLFLRLEETGPVILTGDLYHYTQELDRDAAFVNHASNEITTTSRRALETTASEESAALWIQHDCAFANTLRRAPEYYA